MSPCYLAPAAVPGAKNRSFCTDHTGRLGAVVVWVIRTNFARTGANAMSVETPVPCPLAITGPHVVPSADTCT